MTVSRQMGSLGSQVAAEAALRLGYKMVMRQLINQAALRAGVPEVALATIDEAGILGLKPSKNDLLAYHRAVKQIMLEVVEAGDALIVGRAGQVILQGVPDVLHVRVIAARDFRVARVSADRGISLETAALMVDRSDHARSDYLKRYYDAHVDDPLLYDLIINMTHRTIQDAAGLICSLAATAVSAG